jgi:hypothetical protein
LLTQHLCNRMENQGIASLIQSIKAGGVPDADVAGIVKAALETRQAEAGVRQAEAQVRLAELQPRERFLILVSMPFLSAASRMRV